MTDQTMGPAEGPATRDISRWAPKSRLGRLGHILFWVGLCYGLTWGIAKLCEWLSR